MFKLCLVASGRRDFAHGRSFHSSSIFLSLWLCLLPRLHSHSPAAILPSQWRPAVCVADTFAGCPGLTMTQYLTACPKLPQLEAENKLAANYLSNTCWGSSAGSRLAHKQLVKEMKRGISIWPEVTTASFRHLLYHTSSCMWVKLLVTRELSAALFALGQISLAWSWVNQCWQEENSHGCFLSRCIVCLTS